MGVENRVIIVQLDETFYKFTNREEAFKFAEKSGNSPGAVWDINRLIADAAKLPTERERIMAMKRITTMVFQALESR